MILSSLVKEWRFTVDSGDVELRAERREAFVCRTLIDSSQIRSTKRSATISHVHIVESTKSALTTKVVRRILCFLWLNRALKPIKYTGLMTQQGPYETTTVTATETSKKE